MGSSESKQIQQQQNNLTQDQLNEDVQQFYFCVEGIQQTLGVIDHAYLIIETNGGLYRCELRSCKIEQKVVASLYKINDLNENDIIYSYKPVINTKLKNIQDKKDILAQEFQEYNLFTKNCFHFVYNLINLYADDSYQNKKRILDKYDDQITKGGIVLGTGASVLTLLAGAIFAGFSNNNKNNRQAK